MARNIRVLSERESLALAITLEEEVEADAIRPWCHRSWLFPARRRFPVHASWLNQIEIYFLIVQRKVS